jgi:hypothetical protein
MRIVIAGGHGKIALLLERLPAERGDPGRLAAHGRSWQRFCAFPSAPARVYRSNTRLTG